MIEAALLRAHRSHHICQSPMWRGIAWVHLYFQLPSALPPPRAVTRVMPQYAQCYQTALNRRKGEEPFPSEPWTWNHTLVQWAEYECIFLSHPQHHHPDFQAPLPSWTSGKATQTVALRSCPSLKPTHSISVPDHSSRQPSETLALGATVRDYCSKGASWPPPKPIAAQFSSLTMSRSIQKRWKKNVHNTFPLKGSLQVIRIKNIVSASIHWQDNSQRNKFNIGFRQARWWIKTKAMLELITNVWTKRF